MELQRHRSAAASRSHFLRSVLHQAAPAVVLLGAVFIPGYSPGSSGPELVRPNANTERAGVLRNGVLTVRLDAKEALYHIYGPRRRPMAVEAFAERGKPAVMPGPLVRATSGTEIRLEIHNALAKPITLLVPTIMRGEADRSATMDSIVVAPGGDGVLTTRPTVPGNYVYRATLPTASSKFKHLAGLMAGALIVDSAKAPAAPHEHVFVIMPVWDSLKTACVDTAPRSAACDVGRVEYTINGRSWPNTERIAATVGDSLHWRVISAGADVHPMHLHGFYYRIDSYSMPSSDARARPMVGQLVATQNLTPLGGMSISWSPDRPGNWLFHCHFSIHLRADSVSAGPEDPHMRDMAGLVIGVNVAPRPGVQLAGEALGPERQLRLVALEDSGDVGPGRMVLPSMHFVLEDGPRRLDAGADFSPELDLVRGQPVAITIVNRMAEPTTVHWHAIEIQDSYVDGVPGFSGAGKRLAPMIAPGDSFVARFTPPRSGTFMYHAHVDDDREQSAGLVGALIVRDPATTRSPDDHTFFLKSARVLAGSSDPVEINGQLHPDTVIIHAGRPARFRLISLTAHHNSAVSDVQLQAIDDPVSETGWTTLRWQPIAKDGMDLPAKWRALRDAEQVISIGETYDFEYTPKHPGMLRLLVSTAGPVGPGKALITVPIRVERP